MSRASSSPKKLSPRKKIINKKKLKTNPESDQKNTEKDKQKSAQNAFGDQLLFISYKNHFHSNVLISPLTTLIGLTVCMNGSNNKTLQQLMNVICPTKKPKQITFKTATNIANQFIKYQKYFNSKYDGLNSKPLLKIVNKLYLDSKWKIHPNYIKAVHSDNIECIPFNKSAVKTINGWCQKNTSKKLKKIVNSEMLSHTQLLICNAVYFKGKFVQSFGTNNTKRNIPFYYSNCRNVEKCKVEMMRTVKEHYFKQNVNGTYDIVKLEYQNSDLALFLVIDDHSSDSNDTVWDCFESQYLGALKFKTKKKLDLFVPKFKYDFTIDLRKELVEMGITEAFDRNADFTNLCEDGRGFFVSLTSVIHRASMEVSDEGKEVIKVGKGKGSKSPRNRIVFDHTFMFYVCDCKKEMVLLSGVFNGE